MSDLLSDYDYVLPDELIAQRPVEPRDSSRLFVIHRDARGGKGEFEHRFFRDLPEYLGQAPDSGPESGSGSGSGDLLVANNTQVLKARLLGWRVLGGEGQKGGQRGGPKGGKIEFVLLEELAPRVWEGLFHASAKYLPGLEFEVPTPDGRGLRGKLIKGSAESPSGNVVAEFDRDPIEAGAGEMPLPKYIHRERPAPQVPQLNDEELYQTVYAKEPGSAAAPTAGLHFTPALMERLRARGVGWEEITLHVGVGTFRPVKTEDISAHVMHEERYVISPETALHVTEAKKRGRRVVAVGTTSVRTLESAWVAGEGALQPGAGRTRLFIRPPEGGGRARFQVVDRMITNFHLPRSTLLMLVCAFAGRELVLRAYEEAVRERYRFFSYGDAMLIL